MIFTVSKGYSQVKLAIVICYCCVFVLVFTVGVGSEEAMTTTTFW